MKYVVAFLFSIMLIGCGAAAVQVQPVVPQPQLLQSECLEITAPPEWRLHKAETVRPTQEQIDEGEAYGVFSGMALKRGEEYDLTIIHTHGNRDMADGMFLSQYFGLAMVAAATRNNPAAAEAVGVVSMEVVEPFEIAGMTDVFMFYAEQVLRDSPTVRAWVILLPIDPTDQSTHVMVNTNVPPAEGEQFSGEILDIVRTLRFLCGE